MTQEANKSKFSVALLAPRSTFFGCDPCGGSEVVLREDFAILERAAIPVSVYAQAVADGARARALRVRSSLPLVTSIEYCGRFVARERRALLVSYNEPSVAGFVPDRSIVRFDWTTPLPRYWKLPFWLPRFQRSLYLFPSENERGVFLNLHAQIPRNRTAVITNAVDTALFSPQERQIQVPRVGFAGQWTPVKGIEVLLEAWEKVHQELPQAELWLAGGAGLWKSRDDIPAAGQAQERLESASEKNVKWVGELPRHEMPAFWNSLTVAVVPSLYESFGLAALEALACGVPVVASRAGGLPEIVSDDVCGRLVPPGKPDELAQALLAILANEPLRRRLAGATRQRAAQFSIERRARELLQLFQNRLSETRGKVASKTSGRSMTL
jgi:glycosyltransferase involved in cell wall biosynthesis